MNWYVIANWLNHQSGVTHTRTYSVQASNIINAINKATDEACFNWSCNRSEVEVTEAGQK